MVAELLTEGETVAEALDNVRDALAAVVELYEDLGKTLPLKFNPETQQSTILPDWGSKDLKLGTLRSAIRQLGID